MKKQWNTPTLEVLGVSETLGGGKGGPGKGKGPGKGPGKGKGKGKPGHS